MSGDIKKSIKGRINKIKDTLSRKKELIAAGFMLATGSTGVSSNPIPEHFNSGEEKVVRLPENPSSKIVQDAASEMKSLSTEDAVRTLEEHGAFFVDYENFVKTGDVSSSIVYFTQEQMAEKGLKSIGTSPYDVSLARENHAVLTGDKEKDAETKMKAFSNIKGTFNGGYQFNKSNMENIVLWGLIQEDNQEIKDFCKKFCGHNQTRIMVGRNNVVIERNEDYDKNLSLNDEDAFLYFQSNMYFYPYEDIVTLEEQIQLAKDICKRLELSGISSEIVAEFEELL